MSSRQLNMADDTTASMAMTFDGWNTYKLKLLFDAWAIESQWEFGLSCIAVVFFAVTYQALRFLLYVVEDTMHPQSAGSPFSTLESLEGKTANTGTSNRYQFAPNEGDALTSSTTTPLAPSLGISSSGSSGSGGSRNSTEAGTEKESISETRYLWLRLAHSLLAGVTYGLALLLMLMAMTYNPSIFISLVAGYALGDFIFFARMRPTSQDCH